MRLTTPGNLRLQQSRHFDVNFGGSEGNVAVSIASYGGDVSLVTALPDNPLGHVCLMKLREHSVGTGEIMMMKGERLGTYIVEKAADMRAASVIYDRKDSAFARLRPGMIDWERAFRDAEIFHWSGIDAALTQGLTDVCHEAIDVADRLGLTISCDINYRKNLWQYGKSAEEVLVPLMRKSDIEKELDEKEVKLKESLEKRKEELSSGLSEKAEEIGNGLADYLPKLDETKDRVIAEARKTMDEGIGESSRASKALVEELEKSIGNALSSLDDATHELEGKINDAVGIGVRKVGEASGRLKELEEKIKASESILLSLQSRITKTREAIYNSHESQMDDHGRKEDEISEEKKEMFSSFPDDIILGDEDEIDLSDDE